MNHKELKELIKSTEKQCYLRYKNDKYEVLKEVYNDHASDSIQGVIIGAHGQLPDPLQHVTNVSQHSLLKAKPCLGVIRVALILLRGIDQLIQFEHTG